MVHCVIYYYFSITFDIYLNEQRQQKSLKLADGEINAEHAFLYIFYDRRNFHFDFYLFSFGCTVEIPFAVAVGVAFFSSSLQRYMISVLLQLPILLLLVIMTL